MADGMSNKIGNVFGVEIPVSLQRQLRARKLAIAKGDVKANMINSGEIRDNDTLIYLANKSSWVRLVSSINIVDKADMKYFQTYFPNLDIDKPDSLAKNFILFSGTSKYIKFNTPYLSFPSVTNYQQRSGIERDGAYNIMGDKEWEDYGARPMPGITDVKIETLGKLGSVRSATISLKVWDKYQLDVIDALYFKMGYTMFLEWGHAVYIDNNEKVSTSMYQIVDPFAENISKEELARKIAEGVENSNGNYDAMLGMCTNFTFDFNKEGGYDCTIKLIALGGLADAIKINQSKNLSDELKNELGIVVKKINEDAVKKAKNEWLRQHQYEIEQKKKEAEDKKAANQALIDKAGEALKNLQGKPIRSIIQLAYKNLQGYRGLYDSDVLIDSHGVVDGSQTKSGAFVVIASINNTFTQVSLEKGLIYLDKGFSIQEETEANNNNYEEINLNRTILTTILESAITGVDYETRTGNYSTNFLENFQWMLEDDYKKLVLSGIYNLSNKRYGYIITIYTEGIQEYITDNINTTGKFRTIKDKKGFIDNEQDKGFITKILEQYLTLVKSNPSSGLESEYPMIPNSVTVSIQDNGGADFVNIQYNSNNKVKNNTVSNNPTNLGKQYKNDKSGDYVNSRSAKIQIGKSISVNTRAYKPVAAGAGGAGTNAWISEKKDIKVIIETHDPDVISSVKLKPAGNNLVASKEFEKFQKEQELEAAKKAATEQKIPEDLKIPEIKVDDVTAEEAAKYHSNLEYFLRAIQIHSINKTLSNTKLVVKEVDLEEGDFIYNLMSKGFIPANVIKEFSNAKGSQLPDKWKITNLDSISGYTPRQKLIYSFASYGFNHNLMSRPKYTEQETKDIPQHNFYKMFASYAIPYNPIQALVKDAKIGRPIYIRLDLLLFALNQMCIIYDSPDKKTADISPTEQFPMMYIDFNSYTNTCLTEPAQLSTDPYKFLVEFRCTNDEYANLFAGAVSGIQDDNASQSYINKVLVQLKEGGLFKPESQDKLSKNLPAYKDNAVSTGDAAYRGYFMNVIVNIDYLLDLCKKFGKEDESESVYLKPFLQQLISDLGKSLGDINFFRLAYNDQSNCMYITDDQVSPLLPGEKYVPTVNPKAYEASSELPVYGKYSIAKSLSIKTEVNSKLSNMLAISANSKNKSSLSKDATPFGIYNQNYVDRYKKQAQEIADDGKQARSDISNALFFNQFVKLALSTDSPSQDDIPQATNYYIDRMNKRKSINPATKSSAMIPVSVNITFEGISGFYMGHTFTLPDEVLPYTYTRQAILTLGAIPVGKRVGFVVVGVDHTLQDNQWLTNLRANMIYIKENRDFKNEAGLNRNTLAEGTFESIASASSSNSGDSNYTGGEIRSQDQTETIKNIYIPAIEKALPDVSRGLKALMIAQTQVEGFYPGSKSYRSNNPGNVGTYGQGASAHTTFFPTLEDGIKAQWNKVLKGAINNTSSNYKSNYSLFKYLSVYAPSSDGNDPSAYTNTVLGLLKKQNINITADTTLEEISKIV